MRVEDVAPRTWLLAAVAGWALLAWVLALAGMGGRAVLLAEDSSLLQPLPQPRPSPPDRLGPLGQYNEIGARPLFADDRRPHPFSLQADEEQVEDKGFEYQLTGVLITPQLHMAIVQPIQGGDSVRMKLDSASEEIPAWRLVQLNERSAVFEGSQGRKTLELRVYNGTGGPPPTTLQQANPLTQADQPAPPAPDLGLPPKPMSLPAPISEGREDADSDATAPPPPTNDQPPDAQSQMDAIRQRIEARRAQLRQDDEKQTAPAKKP